MNMISNGMSTNLELKVDTIGCLLGLGMERKRRGKG